MTSDQEDRLARESLFENVWSKELNQTIYQIHFFDFRKSVDSVHRGKS